ncbi:hypothetical protein MZTS_20740 [Methylorubrum zatmanii]|nr:hypothetical protein [Methylorubrum zatmanii]
MFVLHVDLLEALFLGAPVFAFAAFLVRDGLAQRREKRRGLAQADACQADLPFGRSRRVRGRPHRQGDPRGAGAILDPGGRPFPQP